MAPGPVRWPSIASSVPSETFSTRVRFRGWMSEAEGFLRLRLPGCLTWRARPASAPLVRAVPGRPEPLIAPQRPSSHPDVPQRTSVSLRRPSTSPRRPLHVSLASLSSPRRPCTSPLRLLSVPRRFLRVPPRLPRAPQRDEPRVSSPSSVVKPGFHPVTPVRSPPASPSGRVSWTVRSHVRATSSVRAGQRLADVPRFGAAYRWCFAFVAV